jgi:phosphatidylserine/phosphatidylglycerophosphate/cardiolipin synthase-like enzyme
MLLAAALVSCASVCAGDKAPEADSAPQEVSIEAFFGRDCEKALITEIGRAEKDIRVAIYTITRESISKALSKAARRGVTVWVKYDAGQYDEIGWMKTRLRNMKKAGVLCSPIEVKGKYGMLHHKFVVIDGKRVVTGSFNYTKTAAESSYENLVVIESEEVAGKFLEEFDKIKGKKRKKKK